MQTPWNAIEFSAEALSHDCSLLIIIVIDNHSPPLVLADGAVSCFVIVLALSILILIRHRSLRCSGPLTALLLPLSLLQKIVHVTQVILAFCVIL